MHLGGCTDLAFMPGGVRYVQSESLKAIRLFLAGVQLPAAGRSGNGLEQLPESNAVIPMRQGRPWRTPNALGCHLFPRRAGSFLAGTSIRTLSRQNTTPMLARFCHFIPIVRHASARRGRLRCNTCPTPGSSHVRACSGPRRDSLRLENADLALAP
jgi:hypothetical protein